MSDLPLSPPPQLPESFQDCLDFFYARNQFSIKLGLENINALLDRLGRPDAGSVFLHVAGTNGKGSVCANLAALLSATGRRRVGLYTSPHLVSFRERILVDGVPVPADYVLNWLRGAQKIILEINATYFECVTALALDFFRSMDCEAVVLETGLGGRLDATNAVLPAVTVVTSISLDHTAILGQTIAEIWGEKIGILKAHVPMVVQEQRAPLLSVLENKASAMGSPLVLLKEYASAWEAGAEIQFTGRYATYKFPSELRPEAHQVENLCLSLLAMETFLSGPLPPSEALLPFLRSAKLPGRTQLLEGTGMLPVLLDGAHNPGGMAALEAHIKRAFPGRRILALFAVMRDKDFSAVIESVLRFASEVRFVSLEAKYPRALRYSELVHAMEPSERIKVQPIELKPETMRTLLSRNSGANSDHPIPLETVLPDLVVVCGSLYLLGEVIPMLLPYYPGLGWFQQFAAEQ